jgi:hypothetical protein
MDLIEEISLGSYSVSFYDGIDFEMIKNHDSKNLLIFFVDSWVDEVIIYERNCKLKSILDGTDNEFNIHNISNKRIMNLRHILEILNEILKKDMILMKKN